MKKKTKRNSAISICLFFAFTVWTVAVRFADVKPIGPQKSAVGFATLNSFMHNLTGVNMALYTATDWLGLLPLSFMLGFALLGLIQLIKRKSIFKVDRNILILGGFYVAVAAAYVFFEKVVINYRPVLISGFLEASYPSSTTMLVLCVMPTALLQLNERIRNKALKLSTNIIITAFTFFMVIARLVSGVHWLTDIIGGCLLSASLVAAYCCLSENYGN